MVAALAGCCYTFPQPVGAIHCDGWVYGAPHPCTQLLTQIAMMIMAGNYPELVHSLFALTCFGMTEEAGKEMLHRAHVS
jgi:hypothetical protein